MTLLPKTEKVPHPVWKVEKLGPEGKKEVTWGGTERHHAKHCSGKTIKLLQCQWSSSCKAQRKAKW